MEEYTIQKNPIRPKALDYQQLRQLGLDYIANLGNKLWSDYNIHDPGITTLELLCYALTDLGYRTSFDIKDILTPPGGKCPKMDNAFIPAHEILSCQPLTKDDYRKWMMEHIPYIRNVQICTNDNKFLNTDDKKLLNTDDKKPLKGFYRIIVDMGDLYELQNEKYRSIFGRNSNGRYVKGWNSSFTPEKQSQYYKGYIRNMFLKVRNLCEDLELEDVIIQDSVYVGICADIEINPNASYTSIIEEIGKRINDYISPVISYYTLAQMLEKGKPVEDIYRGLVPKSGFIDRDELEQFENKKQLNVSDAINLIMSIDGVINVRCFHFTVNDEDIAGGKVSIDNFGSVKPVEKFSNDYAFRFYNDYHPPERIKYSLSQKKKASLNQIIITRGLHTFIAKVMIGLKPENKIDRSIPGLNVELPLPTGNNRELDQYISIQDEFPKTYKMGKEGIANSETDLRKAQRLQFKAYLTFFDQLLADYLMQLNSVKDIISWKEKVEKTYLYKILRDEEITDFSNVFSDYEVDDKGVKNKWYENLIETETVNLDRRNRFLNHLIARFNEEFVDYSVLEYLINNGEIDADSTEQNLQKPVVTEQDIQKLVIAEKKAFLSNYAGISRDRSRAFDYTEPYRGGTAPFVRDRNVCGLEAMLYTKLGISGDLKNRHLALCLGFDKKNKKYIFHDNREGCYHENFGLHVYEHLLMRPLKGKISGDTFLKLTKDINQSQIVEDPYSMQITVVVPGWLTISGNLEFRKFIEKMIQSELPAHIAAKICWLDPYQMYSVETKYEHFLAVLAKQPYPEADTTIDPTPTWEKKHTTALKKLIGIFSTLKSIYPPTYLYSDDISADDSFALLDFSMLGGDSVKKRWEYDSEVQEKQTEQTK